MLPIRTLMVVLLLFSTSSWARVPTDPAQAEQIFTRWLAAYNAGDRQELQAVLSTYGIDHTAQQYLDIRETFGPFDVLTRTVDTPDTIAAIVRGTSSDRGVLITVAIDPDNRPRLKTLQLEGTEIPDAFKPARLEMPALIAQSRARLDGLQADGKLSGSFLLAKDGEVLMTWQGGLADREQGVAVDAATKFRLASLNKMFTAVGILQLAEAGRLSLDDTIASCSTTPAAWARSSTTRSRPAKRPSRHCTTIGLCTGMQRLLSSRAPRTSTPTTATSCSARSSRRPPGSPTRTTSSSTSFAWRA